MDPKTIIALVIGLLINCGIIGLVAFYVLRLSVAKKIRNEECIFTGERLNVTKISDKSYYEEDRKVHKIGREDGNYYLEKDATIIKGKRVAGDSVWLLSSNSLGYVIERSEKPFSENTTPKWARDSEDSGHYVDKTEITYRVINYGSLTEKQQKKLDKVVALAKHTL